MSFYEDPAHYNNKAGTMVQATGGESEKALLVYVPDDYFKGENAYTDWLENRKNPGINKLTYLEQLKCSIQY